MFMSTALKFQLLIIRKNNSSPPEFEFVRSYCIDIIMLSDAVVFAHNGLTSMRYHYLCIN